MENKAFQALLLYILKYISLYSSKAECYYVNNTKQKHYFKNLKVCKALRMLKIIYNKEKRYELILCYYLDTTDIKTSVLHIFLFSLIQSSTT